MSTDPSAHLAYGIDFGENSEKYPDFLKDHDDELFWWAHDHEDELEVCPYFIDGHLILAVKGHVYTADYGSLVTEIKNLDVDEEKVKAFKDFLIASGLPNPEPKWLLSFAMR